MPDLFAQLSLPGADHVRAEEIHAALLAQHYPCPSMRAISQAALNIPGALRGGRIPRTHVERVLGLASTLHAAMERWVWDFRILCAQADAHGRVPLADAKLFAVYAQASSFSEHEWTSFAAARPQPHSPMAYEELETFLSRGPLSCPVPAPEALARVAYERAEVVRKTAREHYARTRMRQDEEEARAAAEGRAAIWAEEYKREGGMIRHHTVLRRLYPGWSLDADVDLRRMQAHALLSAQHQQLLSGGQGADVLAREMAALQDRTILFAADALSPARVAAGAELELLCTRHMAERAAALSALQPPGVDGKSLVTSLRAIDDVIRPGVAAPLQSLDARAVEEQHALALGTLLAKIAAGEIAATDARVQAVPGLRDALARLHDAEETARRQIAVFLDVVGAGLAGDMQDILTRQLRLNAVRTAPDHSLDTVCSLLESVADERAAAGRSADPIESLLARLQADPHTVGSLPPPLLHAAAELGQLILTCRAVAEAAPSPAASLDAVQALQALVKKLRKEHVAMGAGPVPPQVVASAEVLEQSFNAACSAIVQVAEEVLAEHAAALGLAEDNLNASIASVASGDVAVDQLHVASLTDGIQALKDAQAATRAMQARRLEERREAARPASRQNVDLAAQSQQLLLQASLASDRHRQGLSRQQAALRAQLRQRVLARHDSKEFSKRPTP